MFHVKHCVERGRRVKTELDGALARLRQVAGSLGHSITEGQEEALRRWAALVIEWRSAAQLTGHRTPWRLVSELMEPALYAIPLLDVHQETHTVDFGCGNGCTGVALAVVVGLGRWSLVDRDEKKVVFCRYALSRCRIEGVEVCDARDAETMVGSVDAVLARQLPRSGEALREADQLLRPSGRLIQWSSSPMTMPGVAELQCGDSSLWVRAGPKGCFT